MSVQHYQTREGLPDGWVAQWNPQYEEWFYVNERAPGHQVQWEHPYGRNARPPRHPHEIVTHNLHSPQTVFPHPTHAPPIKEARGLGFAAGLVGAVVDGFKKHEGGKQHEGGKHNAFGNTGLLGAAMGLYKDYEKAKKSKHQTGPGYETMGGKFEYGVGGKRVDSYERHGSGEPASLGVALGASGRYEDKQRERYEDPPTFEEISNQGAAVQGYDIESDDVAVYQDDYGGGDRDFVAPETNYVVAVESLDYSISQPVLAYSAEPSPVNEEYTEDYAAYALDESETDVQTGDYDATAQEGYADYDADIGGVDYSVQEGYADYSVDDEGVQENVDVGYTDVSVDVDGVDYSEDTVAYDDTYTTDDIF